MTIFLEIDTGRRKPKKVRMKGEAWLVPTEWERSDEFAETGSTLYVHGMINVLVDDLAKYVKQGSIRSVVVAKKGKKTELFPVNGDPDRQIVRVERIIPDYNTTTIWRVKRPARQGVGSFWSHEPIQKT
jgi:hypothetical protein